MSVTVPLSYGAMIDSEINGKFKVNPATTTGLTFGYFGGKYSFSATEITVANGTVALTPSTTNYILMNRSSGAIAAGLVAAQGTGTTTLYTVVTDGSGITSITDHRSAPI